MRELMVLRVPALLVATCFALISAAHAQYREPKPCMPYGSFADELRARGIGVDPLQPPPAKFRIAKTEFRGVTQLPDSELKKLVASLQSKEFEDDERFIGGLHSVVRGFWQDRGYFRAQVKVSVQAYGKPADRKIAVGISVQEGALYRLREIHFASFDAEEGPLAFPREQLRAQIPVRDGDIFRVDQIRKGLDELKKLYGEAGYIDFTSAPRTDEHEGAEISLLLRLAQEKQFRIGRISVLGLAPEKLAKLKWRLREGDVFNIRLFEMFFKDNRGLLPADANEDIVQVTRDLQRSLVMITYNFARCPIY